MARKHAFLISIAVALALVAGVYAAMQTTELGASASSSPEVSDAQIRQRDRQLDRIAQKIRTHRKKRPPAVPALVAPGSSGTRASSGGSLSSGPGPGPQILVSNSGPGSASSGHGHDDDGHFDDHGHDDDREDELDDRADERADEREDRLDDAADAAEDRADEREDAGDDD
jgi:hypothetical protein